MDIYSVILLFNSKSSFEGEVRPNFSLIKAKKIKKKIKFQFLFTEMERVFEKTVTPSILISRIDLIYLQYGLLCF